MFVQLRTRPYCWLFIILYTYVKLVCTFKVNSAACTYMKGIDYRGKRVIIVLCKLRSGTTPSHLAPRTHCVSKVRARTPPLVANIQRTSRSLHLQRSLVLQKCVAITHKHAVASTSQAWTNARTVASVPCT